MISITHVIERVKMMTSGEIAKQCYLAGVPMWQRERLEAVRLRMLALARVKEYRSFNHFLTDARRTIV